MKEKNATPPTAAPTIGPTMDFRVVDLCSEEEFEDCVCEGSEVRGIDDGTDIEAPVGAATASFSGQHPLPSY
jgi:hypothetical protein